MTAKLPPSALLYSGGYPTPLVLCVPLCCAAFPCSSHLALTALPTAAHPLTPVVYPCKPSPRHIPLPLLCESHLVLCSVFQSMSVLFFCLDVFLLSLKGVFFTRSSSLTSQHIFPLFSNLSFWVSLPSEGLFGVTFLLLCFMLFIRRLYF